MLENNLENKAKFFGQYWGQDIIMVKLPLWGDKTRVVDSITLESDSFKQFVLQLKPLSAISDEDVFHVGKIVFKNVESTQLIFMKDGIVNMFDSGWNVSGIKMIEIFDHLRSKGYLLPFNGLSCEEILNRGWAVLEQPDNN